MSVDDAVTRYLQYLVVERGLAANTVQSYERDLRRYAGFLGARGRSALADVTGLDVAEFRAALRTGDDEHPPLAVSSVGRAVVAVRGLHAFALREGLTAARPGPRGRAARARQAAAQGHPRRRGRADPRRGRVNRGPRPARAARPRAA